jgi:predicted  nucleic acid-binding Zn-ribbon protein
MPRKAFFSNPDEFNQESMPKKELEHYFSAIQQEIVKLNERMDEMEETLKNILDIVRTYDIERKEIKSSLWEHDKRLMKLERQISQLSN